MPTAQAKTSTKGFARSKSAYHGPDPIQAADQLRVLQNEFKEQGSAEFSKRSVWIQPKNPEPGDKSVLPTGSRFWNRKLIPFIHNKIQKDLDATMGERNIMLKARQSGYTTYCAIERLFIPAVLTPGTNSLLISQNNKYATKHFGIIQRVYRHFCKMDPFDKTKNAFSEELKKHLLHLVVSNRKELVFDMLDSSIIIESAEVPEAGQGVTLNHLHCSEVARWPGNPEETLANIKESVAAGGTIDLESTANGMGNYFHEECLRSMQGLSEFVWHFHEWWWNDEYRREEVDPTTLDDEEKKIIRAYSLDLEQIAFRREKKLSLRHNFDEKYPEDSRTCFLTVTGMYFDNDVIKNRYLELKNPDYRPYGIGAFPEGTKWPDRYKKLEIYKNPVKHRMYIIGADVASGKPVAEGSQKLDWSTAWVIDQETGEQLASFRGQLLPEEFAWELAELGHMYNDALIAVERNQEGGTVLIVLEINCQYTNLYKHKEWWKRGDQWKNTKYIIGFPTTPKTRPIALNRVRYMIMEAPELLYWIAFFEECFVFTRDKTGKPAAMEGANDDTILAGAVAYYVRAVRLGELDPLASPKEGYGEPDPTGEPENVQ